MSWCWWLGFGSLLVDESFVVLECLTFSTVGRMVAVAVDALRCAFACGARTFALSVRADAFYTASWTVTVARAVAPVLAVVALSWSLVVSIELFPLDEEIIDDSELMLEDGERDWMCWIEVDEEDGKIVLLDELVDFRRRNFVVLQLLEHLVEWQVVMTFQDENVWFLAWLSKCVEFELSRFELLFELFLVLFGETDDVDFSSLLDAKLRSFCELD